MTDGKPDNGRRLIPLGVITSAHGLRGQVKIRSFTADPHDIAAYGALRDASGRQFDITITGGAKDALIASIQGIVTREGAEGLRNTELLIPRDALPKTRKNEYYHEDLAGLTVVTEDGEAYGTISGVHNFGAGNLLAIARTTGEEDLLPFTQKIFPRIDLDKGLATIAPPEMTGDD